MSSCAHLLKVGGLRLVANGGDPYATTSSRPHLSVEFAHHRADLLAVDRACGRRAARGVRPPTKHAERQPAPREAAAGERSPSQRKRSIWRDQSRRVTARIILPSPRWRVGDAPSTDRRPARCGSPTAPRDRNRGSRARVAFHLTRRRSPYDCYFVTIHLTRRGHRWRTRSCRGTTRRAFKCFCIGCPRRDVYVTHWAGVGKQTTRAARNGPDQPVAREREEIPDRERELEPVDRLVAVEVHHAKRLRPASKRAPAACPPSPGRVSIAQTDRVMFLRGERGRGWGGGQGLVRARARPRCLSRAVRRVRTPGQRSQGPQASVAKVVARVTGTQVVAHRPSLPSARRPCARGRSASGTQVGRSRPTRRRRPARTCDAAA